MRRMLPQHLVRALQYVLDDRGGGNHVKLALVVRTMSMKAALMSSY